ncbi:MAG: hypothetical protein ACXAEJ_00070 [Candidatus Thorarchaeota archaeon]
MKSYIPFYVPSIDIVSLLGIIVLTFVTAIFASLPSARKLRRIDVDRVIRDRQMT